MVIEVIKREVFGVVRWYPINNNARAIIELMNKKTLNKNHLSICEKFGWMIKEITS